MTSIEAQPTLDVGTPPIPGDPKHVFLNRDLEVQYWSQRFQASRRQLERAVEEVGHSANAIADYLKRHQ